ncbi:hypothetical protein ARMGADRAFT_1115698 [Armillaria gallica]|uniref:Uncharacterized protein n=1 Tax=Armillaria gallica TaxID=47427 RepID=A0A2H3DJN0_ARMGA|nr:hypothetical protein ARMGADRAFT_1115698 [Armillaria gallica]
MSWSKSSFSPDPGVKYRSCRACEFHNGMTRRQELFAPPPWEKHTCHSLNGLSLRHTIHTRKKRPQYSEEEYTTLQTKLRPFDGPFPYGTYDEDEEFAVNMRNTICTSMPSCELMGFPALVSRKRVALRILKNTLNVNLGPSHAVRITRDQYEKTFRYEFELLERLLRQTWAVHISNGDLGVRIDSSIFSQLQAALRRRKQQASRSLVIHEIDLDCPTWGQDISLFMTENDFELYSLCYRASIEYFLSDMDNHHDWETGKPWPTYEELRQHGSKLTHSMRTIADRSEQLKPAAMRHCLRSEPSQSSLLLQSTPNISVKPHSTGNCTDGLTNVSVKASTTSTEQPQSQLKHKLASVPKLDETFNCHNSSNKSGVSSSQVCTEQTEDSQSATSVKTAPILSSTYLRPAVHPIGSSGCDLTTTAAIETNPEVAHCDSRLCKELQGDSYSVNTCDMPTKSQSPIGLTNGSLDVSLTTLRLPLGLKVPSAAGFELLKGEGNQHTLPEGIATRTHTEATMENHTVLKTSKPTARGQMMTFSKESPVSLAPHSTSHQSKTPCQNVASDLNWGVCGTSTKKENNTTMKGLTCADQTMKPISITNSTGDSGVVSILGRTESRRQPQSQQNRRSTSVPEIDSDLYCRNNSDKQILRTEDNQFIDLDKSNLTPSLMHIHRDSQLHTELQGDCHSAKLYSMNTAHLPMKSQPTTGSSYESLNTPVASSMNNFVSRKAFTSEPLHSFCPSKEGTNTLTVEATGKETSLNFQDADDTMTGNGNQYILRKAVATRTQQSETDATMERNHTELKTSMPAGRIADPVERKPTASRAREQKTLSRKMRRALERKQKMDHPQELILPVAAITEQESKQLLAERLQSAVFNIVPSKHKLLGKPEYNQSNQNIQLHTSSNDVPWSISITPIIVSQVLPTANTRTSLLVCSTEHILDPGLNLQHAVKIGIILDINSGKDPGILNQSQNLDTVSRANEPVVVSIRRGRAHHQYHSLFGKTMSASAIVDLPYAKLPPSTLASHEQQCDAPVCRNNFEFTIKIVPEHSSADSLSPPGQVPNPDCKLTMDSSSSDETGCNGIPEGYEPCPPYVKGVG